QEPVRSEATRVRAAGPGPVPPPRLRKRRPRGRALSAELRRGLGAAVTQEVAAALRFIVLADGRGRPAQHVQRPQEPAVRLVLPGNRPLPPPPRTAQLIKAAVITGPGIGVGLHYFALLECPFRQRCPGRRVAGEPGRGLGRV